MIRDKILITGGCGFIGSAFVRYIVKRGYRPVVVDKVTYAGDLKRIAKVKNKIKFYKIDICNKKSIDSVFWREVPQIVVNFAAQTHVDKSVHDAYSFVKTNIQGTQILLDISKKYRVEKFIQISTDEVYGEIKRGKFHEESPLNPNNPYAVSKASADLLIKSYIRIFNFPAIIVRPSNNYGPWQYPEKFIPLAILRILKGSKIPVYGDGSHIREWLYVDDCVEGIFKILKLGKIGEIYNLGSGEETKNINIAKMILRIFNKKEDMIVFVKDRPGHDLRYSLDSNKAFREVKWRAKVSLEEGLSRMIEWSIKNKNWLFSKWADVNNFYRKSIWNK